MSPFTVKLLAFSARGVEQIDSPDSGQIESTLKRRGTMTWLDLCGLENMIAEKILREVFGFHPLVIEDALEERHAPHADDWGDYLYLVLRAADLDDPDDTVEVDVFLGEGYLVTHAARPAPALTRAWETSRQDERLHHAGAVDIMRRLVDEITDDFLRLVDALEAEFEALEADLFKRPDPALLERSFSLKRSLLHLRRFLAPQREVLARIARGDFKLVPRSDRIYFRDASDHFVRLDGLVGSLVDLVVAARDTYLSVLNNRMNDIVRILTVITSLFMPLAFVTGFFGMNFFQPGDFFQSWTGRTVFGLVLASVIAIPAGMMVWMRKRGWF